MICYNIRMISKDSTGKYLIALADLAALVLSFWLALILRFGSLAGADHPEAYRLTIILLSVFAVIHGILSGSGRDFVHRGYFVELGYCLRFNISLMVFWGLSVFLLRMGQEFSRLVFGYTLIINLLLGYLARALLKRAQRATLGGDISGKKVVLLTREGLSDKLALRIKDKLDYGCRLTEVITYGGDESVFIERLKTLPVDEVMIHLPGATGDELARLISLIGTMGIACRVTINIDGLDLRDASCGYFGGMKVISFGEGRDYGAALIVKRLMDIAGGLVGIIITAVMYPFIALWIKADSPGPVVFSQVRIGLNGRRFKIYKFRSMYNDAEARKKELEDKNEMKGLMFKLEDDPRVTRAGRFLRKTSLDEFPQFLNVLKGEMSLVGTRPPTEDEFLKYTPHHRRRLCMTPGLTGLWQVSGRSDISDFDEVVRLDLEYIDNWSIGLDLKIILQTVGVVFMGRGAK